MSTDSLQDPWAELRRIEQRLSWLETASPLENASISRNGLSVLTSTGGPVVKVGHEGGKSGLLLYLGSSWLTVQEHIDARIATSHEYPTNRIGDLEGRMTSAEAGVTYTANRTTDLEGRMSNVEGAASSAQSTANSAASAASAAQSTANTALTKANSSASTTKLNEVIDALNELEAFVRSQHPSKPYNPPIVKG